MQHELCPLELMLNKLLDKLLDKPNALMTYPESS